MVLADATWPEVEAFSRDTVVLIPTGAIEQHGPHLPLSTDTVIAEEIAKAVERNLTDRVLLCPGVWLGMSLQHLPFSGSLSASFESYQGTLGAIIFSLQKHRFHRYYVLNGHGGNSDSNRIVLRQVKDGSPNTTLAHVDYYSLIGDEIEKALVGPQKTLSHAGEAETSLLWHLRPSLVRVSQFRKDGMRSEPPVHGRVVRFDELTENGTIGDPHFSSPAQGAELFALAVDSVTEQVRRMGEPYVMVEI